MIYLLTVKELKKQVSRNDKINLLLITLICLITLTFTVGYSLLNENLSISGEATYRVIADMRVTSFEYKDAYLASESWHNYSKNNIKMEIELSNINSSITYTGKIQNMGENISMIVASMEDNIIEYYPYIKYEISGFTPGTDNAIKNSGEDLEFEITFSYIDEIKNGMQSLPNNKVFIPNIIFNFEEVYAIDYDLAGGEYKTGVDNQTWYSKSTQEFKLNNPYYKKGHTFIGWTGTFLNNISNDVIVVPTDGLTNRTYIANWQINTYVLTINPNGGTYDGSTAIVTSNIIYNNSLTISVPTRIGYIFNGWTLSNSDSTLNGTTFTMGEGNTTLTANWIPINYTVSYDCNGMDGSTASSTHTYDVAKNLTTNGCKMTKSNDSGSLLKTYGGSFAGWGTSSDSVSPSYSNAQSVVNLTAENNVNIPLYAVWNISSVTYTSLLMKSNSKTISSSIPNSSGQTYAYDNGDAIRFVATHAKTTGEYEIKIDEIMDEYSLISFDIKMCTDGFTKTTETGFCQLVGNCQTTITALSGTYNFGVGTSKNYSASHKREYTAKESNKVSGQNRYCSASETLKFQNLNLSGNNNNLYVKIAHGGQFTANTVWLYLSNFKISK